jgi:hypothetical protein
VFQLVLQFKPWGSTQLVELVDLEKQLIEALDGVADIDGHDVGSNEANIFILCSDPAVVFPGCVPFVTKAGLLPILSAAHRPCDGERYTRIWPQEAASPFRVS